MAGYWQHSGHSKTQGDNMNNEEMKAPLKGLSRAHIIALALRANLRAIPNLASVGENGAAQLLCWELEKRAQYLLQLFGVCNARLLWVLDEDNDQYDFWARIDFSKERHTFSFEAAQYVMDYRFFDSGAREAANAIAAARHAQAASAALACSTTYAAGHVAGAPHDDYATDAAKSLHLATCAEPAIAAEIAHDLMEIGKAGAIPFFERPLWAVTDSSAWMGRWAEFKTAALELDAGFDYWLTWLQARHAGLALDVVLQRRSVCAGATVPESEVAAFNQHLQALVANGV
jgi:hypothetical protein